MAKVSNDLFRRLTWYKRYEEFRGNGLGVFRDVREMLLLMEAAGTFNRLPTDVFTAVIDAELDWFERVGREFDIEEIHIPEGFSTIDDQGVWANLRERERASHRFVHTDAELSHRATDYQDYMRRTDDKSVLRDDTELIRVMEAAGTMKRLPTVVRNAFYQAELLWDRDATSSRPKVFQFPFDYVNPYVTGSERDFAPVIDTLAPDPRVISDAELVYGTLHGLPGYEEEWRRRNPGSEAQG